MSSKREQICLDIVKNVKTNNCFGLSYDEVEMIGTLLCNARPNSNPSNFPDFLVENGFIEHFQITSSEIKRKIGSIHQKEYSDYRKEMDSKIDDLKEKMSVEPSFELQKVEGTFHQPTHSYEFLVTSFKKIFEKHMQSLHKYDGDKKNGIFLIDYPEIALEMFECRFNGFDGLTSGDYIDPETWDCFKLSRDKTLLQYIYEFKDELKYVIFVNHSSFEIIKLDAIPILLEAIPWPYITCPIVVIHQETFAGISVSE